ncbi:MAG: hypothetical protein QE280_10135 [Caulobacter sp.]|nr:hypothetical protein [Caulobacter sp.]
MARPLTGLLAAALLLTAGPVLAQDGDVGEIVVTASRIEEFDAARTPAIVLRKRADNLIILINVVCDTRDPGQRRSELKTTLRSLIQAAAKDPAIALGLGEEVVGGFDETMIDSIIGSANRPDTSAAVLLIKTAVTPSDTLDSASNRIETFISKTARAGRTEILTQGDWNLTLVRPEQYRGEIISLIARDALTSAGAFGQTYGVTVEGLNLPVTWYQAGPLDLALYIPYKLQIAPRP